MILRDLKREIWPSNQQEQLINALNASSMVSITDPSGKIIFVNDKFCQASGYQENELIGQSHNILKSGLHPDSLYTNLWQTIKDGEVWTGEICNKSKDDRLCWFQLTIVPFIDEWGEIEKYVAIKRCISELKEKQKELNQSRLNFNQIFNLAPDAYLVCDKAGVVLNCNKAAEALTGYTEKELVSKNIFNVDLIEPNSKYVLQKALENTSFISKKTELNITSKSNHKITLEIVSHKISLNNQEVILCMGRDITERNTMIEDLRKKTLDLEMFVYRASHDMKAPYTTIEGLLNLLKTESSNVSRDTIISMMETTLKNGKSMLDNLDSVGTLLNGSLGREFIDLKSMVIQTISNLSYLDNFEDITFDIDIPEDFMIFSNLYLTNSVFLNLIQNSIKYSIPKSDITSPTVKLHAFKIGKMAVIQVIDNGQGIKQEEQDKVFDLYYRNTNSEGGSGLGLYITKNAVERLGGTISLTSYQNKFTKFEIKIPILSKS